MAEVQGGLVPIRKIIITFKTQEQANAFAMWLESGKGLERFAESKEAGLLKGEIPEEADVHFGAEEYGILDSHKIYIR